jgi:hypothetical protein
VSGRTNARFGAGTKRYRDDDDGDEDGDEVTCTSRGFAREQDKQAAGTATIATIEDSAASAGE